MSGLDALRGLGQRERVLETRNSLENSALDRGAMFIRSTEGVIVEAGSRILLDGTQVVNGTVTITESGQAVFGDAVLSPLNGGRLLLPGGATVAAGSTYGSVGLFATGASVRVSPGRVDVSGLPLATSITGIELVGVQADGQLVRVPVSMVVPAPPATALSWPFPSALVGDPSFAEFGWRFNDTNFHQGIDFTGGIAGTIGTPIPAAGAGKVVYAGWDDSGFANGGLGNLVMIEHATVGGVALYTTYGHMDSAPVVSVNDVVTQGQTLGPLGSSGNSDGPHLHFEVAEGTPGLTRYWHPTRVNPRSKLPPT